MGETMNEREREEKWDSEYMRERERKRGMETERLREWEWANKRARERERDGCLLLIFPATSSIIVNQ